MTDVRRVIRRPTNTTNILGTQVTSQEPENLDSLVYDSTTKYYEMKQIMILDTNQTITGDKTLTGTTQIGPNGTPLTELQFGTYDAGNSVIAPNGQNVKTVTFPTAFAGVPNVQAIVYSLGTSDQRLSLVVTGAPTTSNFTFRIVNEDTVNTDGETINVFWIAYR